MFEKVVKQKGFLFIIFIFLIFINSICSKTEIRYENEILEISNGVRPMGLGGAFVALADDINASYWNPAGLVNINNFEFSMMHATLFELANYNAFNFAKQLPTFGTLSLGYLRLGIDNIPDTSKWYGVEDKDMDTKPEINWVGISEEVFSLSYGGRLNKYFSIGINGKINYKDYSAFKEFASSAFGYSIDGGILGQFKNINLGINIQNIFNGLTWYWKKKEQQEFTKPYTERKILNIKTGILYRKELPKISSLIIGLFDIDTTKGDREGPREQLGIEYWFKKILSLRSGYIYMLQTKEWDLSFGIGFNIPTKKMIIGIDYAFVPYDLNNTHYLGLSIKK